ncbi:Ca2+/H+ antiporter, TMEM165/GDT1 family [Methylomarinovum tepidoasis]|uniref:GDT1 family protein n=1 Tax=Methylomarinovum tepidoasis TaxID=2840183 RepID=A0AAU9C393_9GAMM|nr:TMEM165/GDT1 family protein [Methylomarinovum sp. IN45]BCX87852.1 Ca2+/H+ antiporter, TMEM165/GDT1 family [Methylomarinovum sp. IN45]
MEADWLTWGRSETLAAAAAFALVFLAEFGDKSQLVCMTLAARHRPWPVLLGAVVAFALLDALAVVFGATVAGWLPRWLVGLAVGLLFAGFGIHALTAGEEADGDEVVAARSGHGIFFTTFALIFMAEFGDKTQLAVAGLSLASPPQAVWAGATAALAATSALGVAAGRTLLRYLSLTWIHRLGGIVFLILATLVLLHTQPWARIGAWLRQCWEAFQASI